VAKRFTDTDKWKKPWFRKLAPKWKLAWLHICDTCDSTGVWPADFELMGFQVGEEIDPSSFQHAFGDKVVPLAGGKYFVPSFLKFQYGELKATNPAHRGIMLKIIQGTRGFPLSGDALEVIRSFQSLLRLSTDSLPTLGGPPGEGLQTPQVEEEEEEEVKVKSSKKAKPKKLDRPSHPLVEVWNQSKAPSLPSVRGLGKSRRPAADARWEEHPDPAFWTEVVERINRSPFLTGKNDRKWVADFDFLIRPDTANRVLEGKYDDKRGGYTQPKLMTEDEIRGLL
jgi:hypothetical protein